MILVDAGRAFGIAALGMATSFAFGVMVELRVASEAQRIMQEAIATSQQWEAVAMQWKSNSDRFEAVAHDFRQQALQLQDGFLVCNSMLPVEKRM